MRSQLGALTLGTLALTPSLATANEPATGRWVENRGQWPEAVQFLLHTPSYTARAERDGLALELSGSGGREGALVRLTFDGAGGALAWSGVDAGPGVHNYFLGSDPSRWARGARGFAELRCSGLYPGVDLRVRDRGGRLKYDLEVAPGADLGGIRLRCAGAQALGGGALDAAIGTLLHLGSENWQVLPDGERRHVECTWRELEDDVLGVECPARDPALPLVIDPELVWSSYLGATDAQQNQWERPHDIAVDERGHVVVVGVTNGTDFPTKPGTFRRPTSTPTNVFVSRFRNTDGALLYSSVFGGSTNSQHATGVAVDAAGGVVAVGYTGAQDFPTTPASVFPNPNYSNQGFATSLSPAGELIYSTYLNGVFGIKVTVDVDSAGNAVIGGSVGDHFAATPGAFDETHNGSIDGGVLVLDPSGSQVLWATFLSGAEYDQIRHVDVGIDGRVTVAGFVDSDDFPTTPDAFMPLRNSPFSRLVFVSRFEPDGSALSWSTYLGANEMFDDNYPSGGMAVDSFGAVTVAGSSTSENYPITPGSLNIHPSPASAYRFVTRLTADGRGLHYSTFFGASYSVPTDLAVDPSGVCTLVGNTLAHFPITPGAIDTDPGPLGEYDFYVARLSPYGDRLYYSTYMGGDEDDEGCFVAASRTGRVSIAGQNWGVFPGDHPTTEGSGFPEMLGGGSDVVVTTFDLHLEGVSELGESTPACLGPLRIGATRQPLAGSDSFRVYCSAAPPSTSGLMLVASAPADRSDGPEEQLLWIDPTRLVASIPVASDPRGFLEQRYTLATEAPGSELYFQFVFESTASCPAQTARCASPALAITVQ